MPILRALVVVRLLDSVYVLNPWRALRRVIWHADTLHSRMCCFDTLITWSEVGMMSDITAGTPWAAYSREKLPERGKRGADGRQCDFQPT